MSVEERLQQVHGRILDLDSHELMPRTMWSAEFGEVGETIQTIFPPAAGPNQAGTLDITADSTPINSETVWQVKGPRAPGAADLSRRADVLTEMGIDRQLVFPGFGLTGLFVSTSSEADLRQLFPLGDNDLPDLQSLAQQTIAAHNNWAIRNTHIDSRVRPVGVVLPTSVEYMVAEAERLIEGGVRAIWLPNGRPPADTSPADRALDPFWALLATSSVPLVMHVGGDQDFFRTKNWKRNVPEFEMAPGSDLELPLDPWTFSGVHLAPQNFVTTMVLGGVFERHPELRCGAIEFGGHWVGPMAEQCDLWADEFHRRLSKTLSMKPSEYLRRNFRTTVFDFEPIDLYLERYSIPEVYCFASDFPHIEGGKQPLVELGERLVAIDDTAFENFFTHNAELLLPE